MSEEASTESAPRKFGRFEVLEVLGAGAMGEVFRARDELLARDVAVKTLRALGVRGADAEALRKRFLQEARAVAALSHPHVVQIFDLGVEDDTPYLVMERMEGPSLAERLGQRLLHADEVRVLGAQMARALDAAHARDIVHRDIKPANILEAAPGVYKLADFGVAHVPDSSLTQMGQFLGTPAYAAPEALLEARFGPASDIYSLGATLYEALAGQPPYGPRGLFTDGALDDDATPQPLIGTGGVSAALDAILLGTINRDPAKRPSAAALARALDQLADAAAAGAPPPPVSGEAATVSLRPSSAPAVNAVARATPVPSGMVAPVLPGMATPVPSGMAAPVLGHGPTAPAMSSMAMQPAVAPGAARRPRIAAFVALGLGAMLLGYLVVRANRGPDRGARRERAAPAWQPSADLPALEIVQPVDVPPTEDDGNALTVVPRDPHHADRWRRVQERLEWGETDKARKELRKLVEQYPDDEVARQLLEQLGEGAGGHGRHGHGPRD